MRKLFVLGLVCCSLTVFAQNETVYIFNKDWSSAKNLKSAYYIMQKQKMDDGIFICRYYLKEGSMVRWETYADEALEVPMGRFAWYNAEGKIDSTGNVYKGRKDGTWSYTMKDGKRNIIEEFNKGVFMYRKDTLNKKITYAGGREASTEKPKQPEDTANQKVFTVIQVPAEFENGYVGWNKYISQNLKVPERFMDLHSRAKSFTGVVIVNFVINKEGDVSDIFIEKSCEWSTDTEAIRVLKASSKWTPAVQNGRKVLYRHRQSLSFNVSSE